MRSREGKKLHCLRGVIWIVIVQPYNSAAQAFHPVAQVTGWSALNSNSLSSKVWHSQSLKETSHMKSEDFCSVTSFIHRRKANFTNKTLLGQGRQEGKGKRKICFSLKYKYFICESWDQLQLWCLDFILQLEFAFSDCGRYIISTAVFPNISSMPRSTVMVHHIKYGFCYI